MISDEKLKKELLESKESLFSGQTNTELLRVMQESFPTINIAFVLDWIPEQAEDIYWVLVDASRLAIIEIPRSVSGMSNGPLVEVWSVESYIRKKLSKGERRKLMAAIDLVRSEV
ncbi:hypothetical protein QLG12_06185 [Pseudomonas sp. V88_4]|uniref:hypothetical protein n=1 Tax=Pseudomonas sp. V88_4 TaxID=3044229 RepID=UPI00249E5AFA|nr:hypothetical protein [Pseudomonas sp. V88_4]MDI3397792.1 hypothetical protein [Pseudomonas sp. V88_4]